MAILPQSKKITKTASPQTVINLIHKLTQIAARYNFTTQVDMPCLDSKVNTFFKPFLKRNPGCGPATSGGSRKFWWGGGDFKHKTSKIRMSSPKLRAIFRPKSEYQTIFSPKIRWSPKRKVFTKIESDFSAGFVKFRLVGGMHLEMEPNYSK